VRMVWSPPVPHMPAIIPSARSGLDPARPHI